MDDHINWILFLSDGELLFQVAVKFAGNFLTEDEQKYPLESEAQKKILAALPLHCQNLGKIVDWHEIFETVIK